MLLVKLWKEVEDIADAKRAIQASLELCDGIHPQLLPRLMHGIHEL
jgi:hypothetical protein